MMLLTDNIEVLNVDCVEYMRTLPDNSFDIAIVDPPYNVGASDGTFGNRKGTSSTRDLEHYANSDSVPDKEYFNELFRVSQNQIIWGSNYYPEYLNHSGAIIWHKKSQGPLSDCEIAYQSFNKVVSYYYCEWNGFLKGNETGTKRVHPNQKPLNLYHWCLEKYAEKGNTILDTHLGSGSSAIACHNYGYEFVGCELHEGYFNKMVKRFRQVTSQTTLF